MTAKVVRNIVKIDEEKCNGCGICVPSCAEGALMIIDGKAKLVSETYCDGLGACLGECPQDAITIEERITEDFDEAAVKHHLEEKKPLPKENIPCGCPSAAVSQFAPKEANNARDAGEKLPCGCSAATVSQFSLPEAGNEAAREEAPSQLGHWPVQLTLVPPTAPFLKDADLALVADCVPFAYAGFHQDFLKGHSLLIACPKLDNYQAHLDKLTEILRQSAVRSLTVIRMEVPCCSGLVHMSKQALELSGRNISFRDITIGIKGDIQ